MFYLTILTLCGTKFTKITNYALIVMKLAVSLHTHSIHDSLRKAYHDVVVILPPLLQSTHEKFKR